MSPDTKESAVKKILFIAIIVLAGLTLTCSKAPAESITLHYTVPTVGADSVTCVPVTSPTPVRAVSLWSMRGTTPAANDSLITKKTQLFTPGSIDSFAVSAPSARIMKLYIRPENTAGRSCPSNVVTVVFDGIPPAKVVDLGF